MTKTVAFYLRLTILSFREGGGGVVVREWGFPLLFLINVLPVFFPLLPVAKLLNTLLVKFIPVAVKVIFLLPVHHALSSTLPRGCNRCARLIISQSSLRLLRLVEIFIINSIFLIMISIISLFVVMFIAI